MTQSLIDFFTAWTEADAPTREAQVRGALAPAFSYLDPRTPEPITEADAMVVYVGEFLPMCPPGAQVSVAEPVDEKLGHARATVHFVMNAEMKQVGQYFADLDGAGKITRLVGFAGKGAE